MILFKQDWVDKWPNAVVQYSTKNQSFLDLAAVYRDMGIENHAMILSLLNPALEDIDPWSPDLTQEERIAVATECKLNYWYFIREVARIPAKAGNVPVRYIANRGNIAMAWLFWTHVTFTAVFPRQTGKTMAAVILLRYLLNIGCINTSIALITKDEALRSKTMIEIKDCEDELPTYLRLTNGSDLKNTEQLTVKALTNTIRASVAQKSIKAAANINRGHTTPVIVTDEKAFISNIATTAPAATAGGSRVRKMAKDANEPYGNINLTTAGKKDDPDGSYVYNDLMSSAVWSEIFMDAKDIVHAHKIIRKNSSGGKLKVNCTFNHRQLGFTDEWLLDAIEEAGGTPEEIARDFFNAWTSGSQTTPIKNYAEMIRGSVMDPLHTEISKEGYITRWFLTEDELNNLQNTTHTILAADTSDAIGNDDISLQFRDLLTGAIIGSGHFNETNLITFAEWLFTWFVRNENLTLIIERRSSGASIIDALLLLFKRQGMNPFKRIFNRVVNDSDINPKAFNEITGNIRTSDWDHVVTTKRKSFGFATSGGGITSRSQLYSTTLINAAKYTGDTVHDAMTAGQILELTTRNGRIDHAVGSKDDMVISWLLSYWFLTQAKNLSYYGINPRHILKNNTNLIKSSTDGDLYNKNRQIKLKDDLEKTITRLKEAGNPLIRNKIEREILLILSKMEGSDVVSLDELINELTDQSKFSNMLNKISK